MKKKLRTLVRISAAFLCIAAMLLEELPASADETVESLEQKTKGLQDQLDGLNQELGSLCTEITELAAKLEETNAAVEKAGLDLAAAQLNERLQYDAMKKRIKYVYESGNYSVFEILLSSESMGDFLNKAEFIKNVTEYDRDMLAELEQMREEVKAKEEALKEEQAKMNEMRAQLEARQAELNAAIDSTSGELQASKEQLAAAIEARRAAEEALRQQQLAQQMAAQGAQQTSGQPSDGQSSGGGGGSVSSAPIVVESDEMVLFAAILECEAGSSSYDALLAVATVIMNRVESGMYPNSVFEVVYQRGQFSPTWNGSLSRVLARGPASLCYQVAQDALNGARYMPVINCYEFRAAFTGRKGLYVGDNVFF